MKHTSSSPSNSHSGFSLCDGGMLAVLILLTGWLTDSLPDSFHHHLFCAPASHLAGFFLGTTPQEITVGADTVWSLPHPLLDLHIIRDCSGVRFFWLTYSLAIWNQVRNEIRLNFFVISLLSPPIIYALTIVTNSIRIISVFEVRLMSELALPEHLHAAAHVLSGSLIFLAALILTQWTYERIQRYHTPLIE